MDTTIFVYGIGLVVALMAASLAGMAWNRRRTLSATSATSAVQVQPEHNHPMRAHAVTEAQTSSSSH